MERIQVRALASIDDVCLVWRPPLERIPGCLGFAIERKRLGTGEIDLLPSWIGFDAAGAPDLPRPQPSTIWPIQRYVWIDHLAPARIDLSYRVVPMIGEWSTPRRAPAGWWSTWTPA